MKTDYGTVFNKIIKIKEEENIGLAQLSRILYKFAEFIEWYVEDDIDEYLEEENIELKIKMGDD